MSDRAADPGATVSSYEGKTREEIQSELDRIVEENMMTISVAPNPVLEDGELMFRVPTVVPFSAAADGMLTGPSADATKIENLSVFAVHVTNMKVDAEADWAIVADATASASDNSIDFQIGPEGNLQDAFAASQGTGTDLSSKTTYNMGYAGSATDSIALETDGAVAKVTKNIYNAPAKVATITWTLAAGYIPS